MVDVDELLKSRGLYLTTLPGGQKFAWRLLSLKEYAVYSSLRANNVMHPWVLYTQIFDRCYIGDARVIHGDLPAGIFISIGQLIMWMSGDSAGSADRDDLDAVRAFYNDSALTEHMRHIVHAAFPAYKIEDVEQWTRPELFRNFVQAEAVLVKRGTGYERLNSKHILSPDEAAKKAKKPKIDFGKENAEMEKALGDREHILDQDPAVLAGRMKKAEHIEKKAARLEKSQAEKLEKLARLNRRGN